MDGADIPVPTPKPIARAAGKRLARDIIKDLTKNENIQLK